MAVEIEHKYLVKEKIWKNIIPEKTSLALVCNE